MSQTKSVRPPGPTLAQAAALRPRYLAGAKLADLSHEFGCWRHDLRRMFEALGVLRDEDRLPRLCRVCRAPVRSSSRRDLCADHIRRFCSRCETPLPKRRANRWCTACEQERKPADYELQRRRSVRAPGRCRDCSVDLPPGRIDPRCTRCAAAYRLKRRAEAKKRRCAGCRELIPARCVTYCDNCNAALSQWRRDYRRGKPEAVAIRPLKEYRRWQQKSA